MLVLSVTLPALTVVLAAVAHSDAAPTAPTVPAPAPARARRARAARVAPSTPAQPDERTLRARAHLAAHPYANDLAIAEATGIPRSTVGRWRRSGELSSDLEPARSGGLPS